MTNRTLAFCPGSVLDGKVKPYLAGAIAPNSHMCHCILVPIANPRVFHSALHTCSNPGKEYGLHTLSRLILRQMETNADAKWLVSFSLSPAGGNTGTITRAIPKSFSIRFGAHRDSIYHTP